MKKVLTIVILPILILGLLYLIIASVMKPVNFQKEQKQREAVGIERLKDIRTLQVAYKSTYDRFAPSIDTLKDFYHNGTITVIKQIGSMDDSLAVARGLVRRDSIEIMVRDTLLKGKANVVDSIGIIPFSGGKPIEMDAVVRKVSGINIPLFEARVPYDELLKGLDRQLVVNLKAEKEDMGQYPGLKVGDIENPNNNAGNWEWYRCLARSIE